MDSFRKGAGAKMDASKPLICASVAGACCGALPKKASQIWPHSARNHAMRCYVLVFLCVRKPRRFKGRLEKTGEGKLLLVPNAHIGPACDTLPWHNATTCTNDTNIQMLPSVLSMA